MTWNPEWNCGQRAWTKLNCTLDNGLQLWQLCSSSPTIFSMIYKSHNLLLRPSWLTSAESVVVACNFCDGLFFSYLLVPHLSPHYLEVSLAKLLGFYRLHTGLGAATLCLGVKDLLNLCWASRRIWGVISITLKIFQGGGAVIWCTSILISLRVRSSAKRLPNKFSCARNLWTILLWPPDR